MTPIGPRSDSRARAARALRLRTMCRTWQEIADAEGYKSAGAAANAVQRHLRRQPVEDLATQRIWTGEGLHLVQATLFELLGEAKKRKDVQAGVACARAIADVLDKHAKLTGQHVVVPQEVNVNVHQTAGAVVDRAEEELLAIAAAQPSLPILDAEVVDERVAS